MARTLDEILTSPKQPPSQEPATDEQFFPLPPTDFSQTGLNSILLEELICKMLLNFGALSGRDLAHRLCLPLKVFEDVLYDMKQRLLLAYHTTAGVNDFVYALTEKGQQRGLLARERSAYIGPAPVVYDDYLVAVRSQSMASEHPTMEDIRRAMTGLVLPEPLFHQLGPALHSGQGVFLYGEPGNGKTEVALRIAACFHQTIFIPKTLLIEGHLVQLFDPQCHVPVSEPEGQAMDRRWLRIKRPAVVVGGEMDLSSLEIGFNSQTKVCEASLQMKGNCGIFVVDDFGRQRIGPEQLLNRWILPLEKQIDYLTLPSGTKFLVPFNAFMVFCTNIDPAQLLDEAFLRRLPYKIRMQDPTEEEFLQIFMAMARLYDIPYDSSMANYLLDRHFRSIRPLRGCYPRDILRQLLHIAGFEGTAPRMEEETLDRAARLYFVSTGH